MKRHDLKGFASVEEAASICATSPATIYRRIQEGAIKSFRAGGGRNILISREVLVRFLEEHGIPSDPGRLSTKTRVLIVDDDEIVIQSLLGIFKQYPEFETRSASSGLEAGVALKGFKPHLVLLDIMLQDIDGRKLFLQLSADPEMNDIEVIAMSGYIRDGGILDLLEMGFVDFVAKPFKPDDLMARVHAALATSRSKRKTPA